MSDSKERMIAGKTYTEYNRDAAKKRYDRLKAEGLCPKCAGSRDATSPLTGKQKILCTSCAKILREAKENRSEGLQSQHLP